MDAACDPAVERIIYKKPTQVGGTEVINNIIGYFIDQEPCRIMYAQQTLETAETYSKEILQPMIRDTPCLRTKVSESRARDANSTILRKRFPGGSLRMVGANSPRGFRMTPQRIVIGDDVDGFERNAGDEGSPISLMIRRTSTYPDRKIVLVSSPTVEGISEIDSAYQQSDQRVWEVPCPACGTFQELVWARLKWPSPSNEGRWYAREAKPDQCRYLCNVCSHAIEHRHKRTMNQQGRWRARAPFTGIAGFWHNALASAFETWTEIIRQFLTEHDDPAQFKVFVNTKLAECWKVKLGTQLKHEAIYNRREVYGPELPDDVVVLTAGVDVQDSPPRLEVEVKGWGVGEESWGIEHKVFHGQIDQPVFNPNAPDPPEKANAWRQLDDYLRTTWQHPLGPQLPIACTFIDSSNRTNEVYKFVRPRQIRQIYAIKGSSQTGAPLVNNPTKKEHGVVLVIVGVGTAKSTIYDRLNKQERGPGFCHWPRTYEEDYFKQVVAERLVEKKRMGVTYHVWELPEGERNEGLDLNVYAYAALGWMISRQGANLERLRAQLTASPAPPPRPEPRSGWIARNQPAGPGPSRRGGWMSRR
jgi:phage terminase large subunit GpA-like protein